MRVRSASRHKNYRQDLLRKSPLTQSPRSSHHFHSLQSCFTRCRTPPNSIRTLPPRSHPILSHPMALPTIRSAPDELQPAGAQSAASSAAPSATTRSTRATTRTSARRRRRLVCAASARPIASLELAQLLGRCCCICLSCIKKVCGHFFFVGLGCEVR